ncbi:hypothetical protein [Aliikangiella coralliicola]|uniref:Uncharacterized protein n=1 Tax=Aliikangiella coralliicola TaxID=2592383 RepID=A0A545UBZ0_9GAMM|nr:hypothetical protein [Aliikangiella coralliicola]TQV86980.1 hypothetical protein FLL46_14315 [Aliikangiella coralliicola]
MTSLQQKQKGSKPPKLLRGLFSIILMITSAILLIAWAIMNYQVEQLVAKRTSEYAHSIAQIAANSSAEALLSEDKLQLKMLVENVAKDPYIRSATIFAEDGQVIAEFPEAAAEVPDVSIGEMSNPQSNDSDKTKNDDKSKNNSSETQTSNDSSDAKKQSEQTLPSSTEADFQQAEITDGTTLSNQTEAYLVSQKDIPFVEKISYQSVTAGWFKITLNRELLESSFRESLKRSQNIILIIAAFLLVTLFTVVLRYERRVNSLVSMNHRLIQINAPKLPRSSQQWMESIKEISETQIQDLPEHKSLPTEENYWHSSNRSANTIFCYCQFAMEQQENEQTAACLSLAEKYLQASVQTYGVQSQGDILSGCLIPFLDNDNAEETLSEAISLIHLIRELLGSIELPITMRAYVGRGLVLVLENERAVITGVSLSNRLQDKISKLSPNVQFGDVICLFIEDNELENLGEFKPLVGQDAMLNASCFQLIEVSESLKQQTNRQVSYIIADQSEDK